VRESNNEIVSFIVGTMDEGQLGESLATQGS
jgi:hypothetical protein